MAVRLYLTNSAAGYTPPTIRGTWSDKTLTGASALIARKTGAGASAAKAETSTSNTWAVLLRRFVSAPLNNAATLDGALSMGLGSLESNAAANMIFQLHIYVTVGSTDVVRGVLTGLALGGGAEWSFPGAIAGSGSGASGQVLTVAALTAVAAQPGDRVVVELGYRAQNTVATSYTGTLYYGGTASDLTAGSTAVTTQPGWTEFAGAGFATAFGPPFRSGATVSNTGPVSSTPVARKIGKGVTVTAAGPVSTTPAAHKVMKTTTRPSPVSTTSASRYQSAQTVTALDPPQHNDARHYALGALAVTEMSVASIAYAHIEGDIDYPPPDIELLTAPARPAPRSPLRFIAQDIRTRRWLDWDLPLIDPEITYTLSGATIIQANLKPEFTSLAELNVDPWATWIHVEADDQILASGILQPTGVEDETYALTAIGITGYPQGLPFLGDEQLLETDPCDVIRLIWDHLTSYPDAGVDPTISDTVSPGRLGIPAYQDFDPVTGELLYDDEEIAAPTPETPPADDPPPDEG